MKRLDMSLREIAMYLAALSDIIMNSDDTSDEDKQYYAGLEYGVAEFYRDNINTEWFENEVKILMERYPEFDVSTQLKELLPPLGETVSTEPSPYQLMAQVLHKMEVFEITTKAGDQEMLEGFLDVYETLLDPEDLTVDIAKKMMAKLSSRYAGTRLRMALEPLQEYILNE